MFKILFIFFCVFHAAAPKNILDSDGIEYDLNEDPNSWTQKKWDSILHSTETLDEFNLDINTQRKSEIKPVKPDDFEDNLLEDEVFLLSTQHPIESVDEEISDENDVEENLDQSSFRHEEDSNEENADEENIDENADEENIDENADEENIEENADEENNEDEEIEADDENSDPDDETIEAIAVNDWVVEAKPKRGKRLFGSQRSFIFNPLASPEEEFENCTTSNNETGSCRYLQHCMIPSMMGSLSSFMQHVCIINRVFIGVCCPKQPASIVVVRKQNESSSNETSSLNEACGVGTNTRIVGGFDADPKAWPWMVALLSKSKKSFYCGGALINDRYVLTAAHCTFGVPNNEIIARLGEYDFRDDGESHEEYAVVEIKRHGQYSSRTLRNDIALLKLEKPVVFTEFIKTICFPEENNTYVGENATLAGWGNLAGGGKTSEVLQEATLRVISNEDCSKGHGMPIWDSLICTNSYSGKQGACNGDSGGPLMLLDKNDRWKTIGLVSWGRRGCDPEFPTVYTRVSYYMEWIRKHSK